MLLKVGDNITTDHIMPAGAKVLPLRSNIPAIAEFVFAAVDPEFAERARSGRAAASSSAAQLRPGLEPRARGARADVPGRAGGDRQVLRPHPPGEPDQLRHPAADLREARPTTTASSQGERVRIDLADLDRGAATLARDNGERILLTHQLGARDLEVVRAGGALAHARGRMVQP